jgi:ribonuclease E
MLINMAEGEECRIAVVRDGALEELYLERAAAGRHVGNIYKGRVHNVEPSIQAAFVDVGTAKNGFLHSSDVIAAAYPKRAKGPDGGDKGARPRRAIQDIFRPGDEVLVQITKEGIGTKGPGLTTFLSIPGRYLVLMPGLSRLGVSRKIEDEPTRKALRELLASLDPPKDLGFVVRTAGQGHSKRDLQGDMNYLLRLWKVVQSRAASAKAPAEVFRESDLVVRTLRDIFTPDIQTVWVDSEAVLRRARDFLKIAMPRHRKVVKLHEGPGPLFHKYRLEEAIEQVHSRTVSLPRGGTIVIDQTEALVAIDVNSGTFRHSRDAEESALQLDLMAAKEIARQVRLRDLGGVLIIDFVDLGRPENRRKVEKALRDAFKNDRARHRLLKMSPFGIIEMTRQRVQPSLQKVTYMDCPTCRGTGVVKTAASMALDVVRHLQFLLNREAVDAVEAIVHPDVGEYINNQQRENLVRLGGPEHKRIRITCDPRSALDRAVYRCLDEHGVELPPAALP